MFSVGDRVLIKNFDIIEEIIRIHKSKIGGEQYSVKGFGKTFSKNELQLIKEDF